MEDAQIAFHAAILPNHIDMIIDSGACDVLFPGKDESACTDVQLVDGILTPRINLVASSSSNSTPAQSPAPAVQCSTECMLSLLDQDEICDANSFDQEDFRLTATGIPIILTEHKRYDIYLNSISASPSSHFRSVADHFSRSPESEQTVVRLGMLQDAERSQIGVANLANERLKHPNWYTDLHSHLGALQTDTNPSGSSAHLKFMWHLPAIRLLTRSVAIPVTRTRPATCPVIVQIRSGVLYGRLLR